MQESLSKIVNRFYYVNQYMTKVTQYYLLPSIGMWWHLFWFHILCGTTSRTIRTVRLCNLSVLFCGILRMGVTAALLMSCE